MQLTDRGLRTLKGGGIVRPCEQPGIGQGQGNHTELRCCHALCQPRQRGRRQKGKTAGMAAGDGNLHRHALQGLQQLNHALRRTVIRLIDVQIDAAVVAISQAQQHLQLLRDHGRSTRRCQNTTKAAATGGHTTRQSIRFS